MPIPFLRASMSALVVVLGCSPLAATFAAEDMQPSAAQPEASSASGEQVPANKQQAYAAIKAAQQRLKNLQQKIGKIEKQAKQNDPSLVQEYKDLNQQVRQAMQSTGLDMEASKQRLQELQAKAQDESLSQSERAAAGKAMQQKRKEVLATQKKAMQKPKIQNAMEDWREKALQAMREVDPEIDQLMEAHQQTRQEISSLMNHLRQSGAAQR